MPSLPTPTTRPTTLATEVDEKVAGRERANPSRWQAARWLWAGAGLGATGLGFLGLLLPGLPATPFFLLAAACFSRSSDRLLAWLLRLPRVGPAVRDFRAGLGMPKAAKVWSTVVMALCVSISAVAMPRWWQGVLTVVLALIGLGYIWLVIPTKRAQPGRTTVGSGH